MGEARGPGGRCSGLFVRMICFVLMISGTCFSAYLLLMKLCGTAFDKPEL